MPHPPFKIGLNNSGLKTTIAIQTNRFVRNTTMFVLELSVGPAKVNEVNFFQGFVT